MTHVILISGNYNDECEGEVFNLNYSADCYEIMHTCSFIYEKYIVYIHTSDATDKS